MQYVGEFLLLIYREHLCIHKLGLGGLILSYCLPISSITSSQIAEILVSTTSQPGALQPDAISEASEVIETVLTDAAIADPMV